MSKEGRTLRPGDEAFTDYEGNGFKLVRIVDRLDGSASQSTIVFRVSPSLKNGDSLTWYDADWFYPVPKQFI